MMIALLALLGCGEEDEGSSGEAGTAESVAWGQEVAPCEGPDGSTPAARFAAPGDLFIWQPWLCTAAEGGDLCSPAEASVSAEEIAVYCGSTEQEGRLRWIDPR